MQASTHFCTSLRPISSAGWASPTARAINIISVAIEAPQDAINALTGKLGRLPGVSAKTMYSGNIYESEA